MQTQVQNKSELSIVLDNSGIEKTKGELISNTLNSFFVKANDWNETIESLQINDISETGKMKMAREGRLTLRRMRLDAKNLVDEKRSEVKAKMADYVLEDKLWLKSFQMVEATFKNLEVKLEEKEKFAERKEQERLNNLDKERTSLLIPYNEFCSIESMDLRSMTDEDFKKTLDNAKRLFDLDVIEKQKAEEERIAKEKAEAEAREKQRLENERLKAEAEKREKEIEAERLENEKKLEAERAKAKAEAERIEAENAKRLKAEQEAKRKLEAELQAKRNAEIEAENKRKQAELQAKAEAEKQAKAPLKDKLIKWVDGFRIEDSPLNEANPKAREIIQKFESFKKWAKNEVNNI